MLVESNPTHHVTNMPSAQNCKKVLSEGRQIGPTHKDLLLDLSHRAPCGVLLNLSAGVSREENLPPKGRQRNQDLHGSLSELGSTWMALPCWLVWGTAKIFRNFLERCFLNQIHMEHRPGQDAPVFPAWRVSGCWRGT